MLTLFCKQNRQISLPKSGHTLDAILNDWLDHTRAKVKRSTFATYLGVADRYVRSTLGALTTDELTNAELEKFLESAARTYSSATVRVICHVLRAVLEYASAQGYATPAGPGFAAPKSEYREARTLSSEEQLRLLDWLRSRESPAEFGILLCLATGMRLGEACGLRWDDIPEGRYIIYIRRTLQRLPVQDGSGKTALVFGPPKSASSARAIPVPASLRDRLDELRRDDSCYVLTGTDAPMEPRRFQRQFKSALRAAGVQDINFHALRHTFATNCVSLGCDAATLARLLGHSDVAVTLNTYVHPSFEAMRDIVDKNSARFAS